MSKDYTTIRVEQNAKDTAEQAKSDGETWSDYIRRCTDNPPEVREFVERDGGDPVQPELDTDGIAERIVDRIEETQGVTIETVEIDNDGNSLTREEVEGVVESWVERNYDRLRRGEIG